MSEEHELEDVSREEAGAVLYRLADGVAVGSVQIGQETVAVPERLDVEIEQEIEADERELEVDLEWPLSAEENAEVAVEATDEETEVASGEGASGAGVQETDSPVSPTAVVEPGDVEETGSDARFELFEDSAGEWRWRLVHANGNVIADSGEGYSRKANAQKGLESVMRNAAGASVVEE